MFGHLLQLQRRLGKENFPLIEQTFYPNHREMVSPPNRMAAFTTSAYERTVIKNRDSFISFVP